jgi:hypothetical protein
MTFPLLTGGVCTLQPAAAVSAVLSGAGASGDSGPITLTATAHGLVNGDIVAASFTGAANSTAGGLAASLWIVAVVDANHFSLVDSNGTQTGTGGGCTYVHVGHVFAAVEVDSSVNVVPALPPGPTLKCLVLSSSAPVRVLVCDGPGVSAALAAACAVFQVPGGVEPGAPVEMSRTADELPDALWGLPLAWSVAYEYASVVVLFANATKGYQVGGGGYGAGSSVTLSVWLD